MVPRHSWLCWKVLKQHSIDCKVVKKERMDKNNIFNIDASYFNSKHLDSSKISTDDRYCMSCKSELFQCRFDNYTFKLEQMALNYIIDQSMIVKKPFSQEYPAGTTQELLLRHYFRGQMPDLLFIGVPFNHEIRFGRTLFDKGYLDLQYFSSLLDFYLPKSTKIVWVPNARLFPTKERLKFFPIQRGLTQIEQVNMLNVALFHVIKDKFMERDSNTFAYYDAIELTCQLEKFTDKAGVHYLPFYYETMIRILWQLLE